MSSRLQLDMQNLSLGRRHLVNAYEVEASIGVSAGKTVWSMPERLECEVPRYYKKSASLYKYTCNLYLYKYTYLYLYKYTCNLYLYKYTYLYIFYMMFICNIFRLQQAHGSYQQLQWLEPDCIQLHCMED